MDWGKFSYGMILSSAILVVLLVFLLRKAKEKPVATLKDALRWSEYGEKLFIGQAIYSALTFLIARLLLGEYWYNGGYFAYSFSLFTWFSGYVSWIPLMGFTYFHEMEFYYRFMPIAVLISLPFALLTHLKLVKPLREKKVPRQMWFRFLSAMGFFFGMLIGVFAVGIADRTIRLSDMPECSANTCSKKSILLGTKKVVVKTMNKSLSLMILLAVSVGVAFGSGYWLGALSVPEDEYVKENLWCLGTDIVKDDINGQWNISTTLENIGHENSTVVVVLINGRDTDTYGDNVTVSPLPMPIKGVFHYRDTPGKGTMIITIKYGTLDIISGLTIEIKFHTNGGWDYPLSVTLP